MIVCGTKPLILKVSNSRFMNLKVSQTAAVMELPVCSLSSGINNKINPETFFPALHTVDELESVSRS